MRILRIEDDVDGAGAVIEIEDFFPALAAVARTKNTSLRVGSVGVAERGDEDNVRICWMDDDRADVARVFQADVGPRFARVGGFVDPIAERDVAADAGFAGADVNDVGIGIGNVNRTD